MDAQVILSAVFRDPTREGRSQFVKIWFLTSNLPDWLLPDVKIVPIIKGVVSFTFRRLPPRDLTLTLDIQKRTYQYLGGSGKAELKTLLQKVNDPGYTIHGHLVVVPLDGPASHTLDFLKAKCDSVPVPNSGDGIVPVKETPAFSLDRVKQRGDISPEPKSKDGTIQLYTRSLYPLDFLKPLYDRVPGPFSVESIIPRCGLMKGTIIIPFAKLLSHHAVINASTGKTSIDVSASSPEIKTELTPQTVDKVLTPDQTKEITTIASQLTTEPNNSKPTKTQKAMSWWTWGVGLLKDAGMI